MLNSLTIGQHWGQTYKWAFVLRLLQLHIWYDVQAFLRLKTTLRIKRGCKVHCQNLETAPVVRKSSVCATWPMNWEMQTLRFNSLYFCNKSNPTFKWKGKCKKVYCLFMSFCLLWTCQEHNTKNNCSIYSLMCI